MSFSRTGSAPSSPDLLRRPSPQNSSLSNGSSNNTPTPTNQNSHSSTSPTRSPGTSLFHRARAFTSKAVPSKDAKLQGPLMSICLDCKCMVVSIIRASRCAHQGAAPDRVKQQIFGAPPKHSATSREFTLDLKPVYK